MGNVEKPGKNRVFLGWTWPTLQIGLSGKNGGHHAKGTLVGCRVCHPLSSEPEKVSVSYRQSLFIYSCFESWVATRCLNWAAPNPLCCYALLKQEVPHTWHWCFASIFRGSPCDLQHTKQVCFRQERASVERQILGDIVLWEAFLGGEQRWREAMP